MANMNQLEPSKAIRCASDACGQSVIGYVPSWYSVTVGGYFCLTCAGNEWQRRDAANAKIMSADRAALGDEAFVKLVLGDGWCEPSGERSVATGKFYILTWNTEVVRVTGTSGYHDTPEAAWTTMADKIDRYIRKRI